MKKQSLSYVMRPLISVVILGVLLVLLGGCGAGTPTSAASPTGSTSQVTGENHPPVVDETISEWHAIERGKSGGLKCIAHDPDGDKLTYEWEASRGSISGTGPIVKFNAPNSYVSVTISVRVSDGRGGSAYGGTALEVVCCSAANKNSDWSK